MFRMLAARMAVSALIGATAAHAAPGECVAAAARLDQLQMVDATLSPATLRSGEPAIVTLATLRNNSDTAVEEVQVEVKFFDAQKQHIDTNAEVLYVSVPAHGEIGIRARRSAAQPVERYANQSIRIVSAEPVLDCRTTARATNPWIEALIAWGPMILLVLVLVWMSRSKRSPSGKLVGLYEQHLKSIDQQNQQLARMADAMERRPPTDSA